MFILDEIKRLKHGVSSCFTAKKPASLMHDKALNTDDIAEQPDEPVWPRRLNLILLLVIIVTLCLLPWDAALSRMVTASQFIVFRALRILTNSLMTLPYIILFIGMLLISLFYRRSLLAAQTTQTTLPLAIAREGQRFDPARLKFWNLIQRQSFFALIALLGSGLIINILKGLVGRARPHLLESAGAFSFRPLDFSYLYVSFPSGHAATAGVLAMLFSLWLPRFRALFFIGFFVLATSRVAVQAHYPTDVLGGFTIGVLTTLLLARFLARNRLIFSLKKHETFPQMKR